MLRTLIESNAPPQRRRASTVASVVIHTAIIGGAVVATASARAGRPLEDTFVRDSIIYVDPTQQPPPRRAPPGPATHGPRESLEGPRIPPISFDPQPGVPKVPIEIDVQRLVGSEAIGETQLLGPRGPLGIDRGGRGSGEAGPATAATVDRPASLVAPPRPRYPEALRAAGVTGRVVMRLVVDTAGRVEPSTVAVLESSHDLFLAAVRAVLPSLRFRPAEVAGRKVRMLVELPFEFRLND